jgi:two-component system, cell cycle sensor histidine kinase and response regulator CckA
MSEADGLRAEIARLRAIEAELTARVARAEEELEASRALHAATVEGLPFDFWARDKEGYCFSQNATCKANWGDLLDRRPEDMPLPASVIEIWLSNNRRALAGEIVRGDVQYATDRGIREFHNVLAPIRLGDEIVGTLGVNIEVTDRNRALEALRESEEKLRVAVEAAGVGLWSWEPARDHLVWEPTICAIFGLPAGSRPSGRDGYLAHVHPDDRALVSTRIAEGLESGRWEDEYRIIRADGAVRWVLTQKTVLRDGDRTRVVGAVIDVTERRMRDEQLRQAQKLEAVGQLTAGIAHNFNNMLMGVLPNLELAARRAPEGLLPLLESASNSARRAADLVRKLMTYAGQNRPTARVVEELGPLVARAVELCRTTFDTRIEFEQSYEAGAGARMDAAQIEQALVNVLINARDALESTVAGPRVAVSVTVVHAGASELSGHEGDYVRVRIADNGQGMEAATAARIYDPFFTTKDVGKGTGLGLATTQAIVHEHGGFIVCESARDEGTTFSLYLPHARASATSSVAAPDPGPIAGGKETLLVIDDEPAVRRIVALLLRSAGYVVHESASGNEALELLSDRDLAATVALVLLDVSMPGLSRHEIRSRLRDLTNAHVVYFTGYAFEATDAQDVVLEKPVTEERLLRTIREVLDRKG